MPKIDPMQKTKEETGEGGEQGKIQVVCGLGVVLTSKGTIEVIEIKGMPMPEVRTACALLSSASTEMQSNVIAEQVYRAFLQSMEKFEKQKLDPDEEETKDSPVLTIAKKDDLPN